MSTVAAAGLGERPALSPAARRAKNDRWFFSGTAIAQVVLVVWGFSPSYFLRAASDQPPLSGLLHVHGALFSSWLLLLVVQTSLVAAKRTPVHRQLGVAGGALAAAMFVAGYLAAIDAAARGSALPGMTPQAFLIIPILGIVLFAVLVGAALALRRRPDYHKRLMMLATTGGLMGAGLARIPALAPYGPLGFLGVPVLFALMLVAYDAVTLRRVHPATLGGFAFILGFQALQLTAANSAAWLAIAGWLTA
jgi:hypothetical protein